MEKRGALKSTWGVSEKGRRAKCHRLTAAGARELDREQAQWSRYVDAVARIKPRPAEAG